MSIVYGLDLAESDAPTPSRLDQMKRGADDVISWLGSHKEDLMQGYALIKGLIPSQAAAEVPPIPNL